MKIAKIFISLLAASSSLWATESLSAAYGTGVASTGSVSFSVGQLVYTSNNSAEGTVSNGFVFPYSVDTVLTKVSEDRKFKTTPGFVIGPNPAEDFVTIYALKDGEQYTLIGNGLKQKNLTNKRLDVSNLTAGVYYILTESGNIGTFYKN